ncbi:hypothetical protein BDBG_17722 [Blastomyces gilchristii SLH14081]|uniref:Uncharacterized protein n=1 Tax=Blastomyces gilchristii (strain SLH14081) TaxID=559298 RepID=A0A179UYL9_BLAGS|nr:uncharacterized protein BDBG_17722 [Blastomyces gilchristii SLH14081]OAT12913.1 hypothetical protein BDBG_17722 [Blastomyces gilchristii SLH14081]
MRGERSGGRSGGGGWRSRARHETRAMHRKESWSDTII